MNPSYQPNNEIAKTINPSEQKEAELLFFSVDWCPHCKTAKPAWNDLKAEYENVKCEILEFRNKYEESENELHELYNQKQIVEGRFTVEALIEEMRKHIDENYQKPRQKLVSEFNSKQIDFEAFKVANVNKYFSIFLKKISPLFWNNSEIEF